MKNEKKPFKLIQLAQLENKTTYIHLHQGHLRIFDTILGLKTYIYCNIENNPYRYFRYYLSYFCNCQKTLLKSSKLKKKIDTFRITNFSTLNMVYLIGIFHLIHSFKSWKKILEANHSQNCGLPLFLPTDCLP